jgi:hypothetical protein
VLGYGDLDLLLLDLLVILLMALPPLRLPSQKGVGGRQLGPDSLIGDAIHVYRLLALTQCPTALWLSSVGSHSIPNSSMWSRVLQSIIGGGTGQEVELALAPVSRLSWKLNHVVLLFCYVL